MFEAGKWHLLFIVAVVFVFLWRMEYGEKRGRETFTVIWAKDAGLFIYPFKKNPVNSYDMLGHNSLSWGGQGC